MKVLVTGAGGFLGGALARVLRARGDDVRGFSRGAYPELHALGIEQVRGDLGDAEAVARAAAGCELVFHAAAKAGIWGPYQEYHRANVLGTRNVLDACRAQGIRRLVFTSSPSVTFAGRDQEGVDESAPYPARFLAHYPRTKAEAERMVLEANGPELATVALRPHLIWGPGDPHLVPRVIARAKAGTLRLVGAPKKVDSTYIENAVAAHLLAGDRVAPGAPCAGKAYFIGNGEPVSMAELFAGILHAAGLPPVERSVSPAVAYAAGAVLESWYALWGRDTEPPMTRFLAQQLATAHWFDLTAARRDLDYLPAVSLQEGFRRLADSLRDHPPKVI